MSAKDDLAIGETYVERLDRDRQAQEHERSLVTIKEKNATKRSRHEAGQVYAGIVAALLAVAIAAVVFFTDIGESPQQQPKVTDAMVEQQREERCIDTGGGWVPESLLYNGTVGLCVYPGRVVDTPAE